MVVVEPVEVAGVAAIIVEMVVVELGELAGAGAIEPRGPCSCRSLVCTSPKHAARDMDVTAGDDRGELVELPVVLVVLVVLVVVEHWHRLIEA